MRAKARLREPLSKRLVLGAAAVATAAAATAPALAAGFGVPGTGPPAGYLVLASTDAGGTGLADAFGDVARMMTFYIEVTDRRLAVEIYDPGLYWAGGPADQLDLNLDPPSGVGAMRYVLYDPDRAVLADATFAADTAATDRSLVTLYSRAGGAANGVYVLDCFYEDGPGFEQDLSVFGIRAAGHDVWTYNLTAGHVKVAGATIAEPVSVYPWIVAPSAGADSLGPVCGVSLHSYDLDADLNGVAPPYPALTTRRLFTFPSAATPPSGDGRFWKTDLGGVPYGLLDSDDHGIYRWDFSGLDLVGETLYDRVPAMDLNVFSVQVLDYGVADRDFFTWPVLPPVLTENPRRLYLPRDDGSAPRKEDLGHRAAIVSGYSPITVGESTTLEVTLSIRNPSPFPLDSVSGTTYVTPDPDASDPFALAATGVTAAFDPVNPRRIDLGGTVAAASTAEVRYRVTLLPTAPGRRFLTGDGSDFLALAAPTTIAYGTPFTRAADPPERLGPACQIEYQAVPHPCVATAAVAPSATRVCPGTDVTLDGAGSAVVSCPGGSAIFQWRANGAVIRPFPAAATLTIPTFLDTTYTLEVMCSTDVACIGSKDVVVTTYPGVDVAAGPDRALCPGDPPVTLTAAVSGGTPPYAGFLWTTSPPGEPGDGATTASITVSPTATTVYTFAAEDALACAGADSVTVALDPDARPAPVYPLLAARRGPDVELSWTDLVIPAGAYHAVSLPCDGDLDGTCETHPDVPSLDLRPFATVPPGTGRWTDAGGVASPSFLVHYRVRAASACTATPGEW